MGQRGPKMELQINNRTLEYVKRLMSEERIIRWTLREETRLKERLYKGCERYIEDFKKWSYDMALDEEDDVTSNDTTWLVWVAGNPWRYVDAAREEGLLVIEKKYIGETKIEISKPYLQKYKIGELEPIVRHLLRLEKKVTMVELEPIVQYLLLLEKTVTMAELGPIVRHLALLEKKGRIPRLAPPAVPTPEQDSNPDVDPDLQALCDADF